METVNRAEEDGGAANAPRSEQAQSLERGLAVIKAFGKERTRMTIAETARAVGTTVRTNLLWAFGYNLVALTLAASGMLQPIIAAAVMAGSSILVVLNSLRLERLPAQTK